MRARPVGFKVVAPPSSGLRPPSPIQWEGHGPEDSQSELPLPRWEKSLPSGLTRGWRAEPDEGGATSTGFTTSGHPFPPYHCYSATGSFPRKRESPFTDRAAHQDARSDPKTGIPAFAGMTSWMRRQNPPANSAPTRVIPASLTYVILPPPHRVYGRTRDERVAVGDRVDRESSWSRPSNPGPR
jgi:hypothetical protein